LLDLVDGRRTLIELCQQGPFSPGINARTLYAMRLLELIEKKEPASSGIRIQVRGGENSPG